jgi:hypothetical protein
MAITTYVYDASLLTASVVTKGDVVPANTKRFIKAMTLYNGTAAPVVCEVHLIPSGGTASDTNRIIHRTLAAEETYTCPEAINKGMNAAGFIQALGLDVSFGYNTIDITNS